MDRLIGKYRAFSHHIQKRDGEGLTKDYWYHIVCDNYGVLVTVFDHPLSEEDVVVESESLGQTFTETYENKLQVHLYDHDDLWKGSGPTQTIVLVDDLAHWQKNQEDED